MDQEEGAGQTFQARRRGCRKFRKPKTVCIFRNEKQNRQGGRGREDVDISRDWRVRLRISYLVLWALGTQS